MKSTIIAMMLILFGLGCKNMSKRDVEKSNTDDPFSVKREQMVKMQIEHRGVTDAQVLKAMRNVPRHQFVPEEMRRNAYLDQPLPIGFEQTISQPYIVAYMTEALDLKKTDKVLEIGTGSGYQAAILGEIVDSVYTIEILDSLSRRASRTLKDLGYDHVICRAGDGYQGWPEAAPFDAIILTAAPPKIPDPLVMQLKDGGRMILPVGEFYQELIRIERRGGAVEQKRLLPVRFVPMTGEVQKTP